MVEVPVPASELREENIHRTRMGLPSGVLRARTDLIPHSSTEGHEYLYPVSFHGRMEGLDERLLADLLSRVRKLEQLVAAQGEVIRNLVTWRFSQDKGRPSAAPSQGKDERQPGGLPDFLS